MSLIFTPCRARALSSTCSRVWIPRMPRRSMISMFRYPVSTRMRSDPPVIRYERVGTRAIRPGSRASTRKLESSSMSPMSRTLISMLMRPSSNLPVGESEGLAPRETSPSLRLPAAGRGAFDAMHAGYRFGRGAAYERVANRGGRICPRVRSGPCAAAFLSQRPGCCPRVRSARKRGERDATPERRHHVGGRQTRFRWETTTSPGRRRDHPEADGSEIESRCGTMPGSRRYAFMISITELRFSRYPEYASRRGG